MYVCKRKRPSVSSVCGENVFYPVLFSQVVICMHPYHTQRVMRYSGTPHCIPPLLRSRQFDALIVDPSPGADLEGGNGGAATSDGPFDMFPELGQGMQTAFEKFIFLGDDRNIEQVYVAGNRVI